MKRARPDRGFAASAHSTRGHPLEPFRGLRAKLRRLDRLSEDRMKEYERLFG